MYLDHIKSAENLRKQQEERQQQELRKKESQAQNEDDVDTMAASEKFLSTIYEGKFSPKLDALTKAQLYGAAGATHPAAGGLASPASMKIEGAKIDPHDYLHPVSTPGMLTIQSSVPRREDMKMNCSFEGAVAPKVLVSSTMSMAAAAAEQLRQSASRTITDAGATELSPRTALERTLHLSREYQTLPGEQFGLMWKAKAPLLSVVGENFSTPGGGLWSKVAPRY